MMLDLDYLPHLPPKIDYRIGCIGSGFIMREVQLLAYAKAGFNVVAIASRSVERAQAAATARGIATVHRSWQELLDDERIEIVDIAYPPDQQEDIVREAVRRRHVKGILAQKPLAMNYSTAKAIVEMCEEAGVVMCVNQNMRYDQAMRALKSLLARGALGTPVLATIELRVMGDWQSYMAELGYNRWTLLNMSVHHLDIFRFLFGEPERIIASACANPRTLSPHNDGIALYILEYAGGLRAAAWDDLWAGPDRPGAVADNYIKWRVEGTEGLAQGTIGWPKFGGCDSQSTLEYMTNEQPGLWFKPRWQESWFPDAFIGPMAELMTSVQSGQSPNLSGRDNLTTMALVEAAYQSLETHRAVSPMEIMG